MTGDRRIAESCRPHGATTLLQTYVTVHQPTAAPTYIEDDGFGNHDNGLVERSTQDECGSRMKLRKERWGVTAGPRTSSNSERVYAPHAESMQ